MRALSLFSGIEAATVAAPHWNWLAYSEIDKFPCAVLRHHYPDTLNLGDVTAVNWSQFKGGVDVLIGGSPCQAFSIAGLRRGLSDARGNLTLAFVAACNAVDPEYIVWENVPGVLSSKDNAFGSFLAGLAGETEALQPPGGRWTHAGVVSGPQRTIAWRVLDAQYFGVAQRRRRVFVIASRGSHRAVEILFEFEGVRRDSAPCREAGEAGEAAAGILTTCASDGTDEAAAGYLPPVDMTLPAIAHTLTGEGFDASEDGCGRGTPLVPAAVHENQQGDVWVGEILGALTTGGGKPGQGYPAVMVNARGAVPVPVAVSLRGRDGGATAELTHGAHPALRASQGGGDKPHVLAPLGVRRLTPVECERLQGFPDGYTLVPHTHGKPAADGPRYKSLGNSMAVPVVRWLIERVERDWILS